MATLSPLFQFLCIMAQFWPLKIPTEDFLGISGRAFSWNCSSHFVTMREMSRESDIGPAIIELLNQSQSLLHTDSLLCQKNEPMFVQAIVVRFCFLQPKAFRNNTKGNILQPQFITTCCRHSSGT